LPGFLRWFASTFFSVGEGEGIDAAFQFLQACEFSFPRTLAAVEALVRQAMPDADFSYGAYIAAMECWFRPPWMKELDEAGIPLPLAERLAPHVGDASGRTERWKLLDLSTWRTSKSLMLSTSSSSIWHLVWINA
jgi:hypothetical protein